MNNLPVILLIIFVIFIIIIFVSLLLNKGSKEEEKWKIKTKEILTKLTKSLKSNNNIELKNTLVEFDKLLDFVLKNNHTFGETLGERLKNISKHFDKQTYNEIWNAHKERNKLAHEIDYNPQIDKIRQACFSLKKAIESFL